MFLSNALKTLPNWFLYWWAASVNISRPLMSSVGSWSCPPQNLSNQNLSRTCPVSVSRFLLVECFVVVAELVLHSALERRQEKSSILVLCYGEITNQCSWSRNMPHQGNHIRTAKSGQLYQDSNMRRYQDTRSGPRTGLSGQLWQDKMTDLSWQDSHNKTAVTSRVVDPDRAGSGIICDLGSGSVINSGSGSKLSSVSN